MEHIPARWYRIGRIKSPRLIVVHCTVSREMGTGAEAVAHYFATTDRRASAHRVVDNNSTVMCVRDKDTAFGAAGANADGLHLELVGLPEQSTVEWTDDYSTAELKQAAPTVREWSTNHDIPITWLTVDEVADGTSRGLCTHADASRAFPAVSTGHWDPGPNFPKTYARGLWLPTPPAPPAPNPGDDMFTYDYKPAGSPTYSMVLVANGKQVALSDQDVFAQRRRCTESHLRDVDPDEVARFAKAFGPIVK